jgi:hypothetical protein
VRVRAAAASFAALGCTPVAVGFSPPEALRALAERLGWPWPFLADTERLLYRRLGFGRAPLRNVWTPATLAIYRRAMAAGTPVHKPVEDARQLGGDAIVRAGTAFTVFRPASPDAREPVETLLEAVRAAAT